MSSAPVFRKLVGIALVAGLLVGACGEPSIQAGGPGEPSPSNPDDVVSSTPQPGDNEPGRARPQFVKPRLGMADLYPTAWTKAKVSGDGRLVTIRFYSGVEPCYVLDHVDVDYAATKVTITLYQGHDPNAGDVACIELAVLKGVRVQLDEPLGDRKLVDGGK